MTPDSENRTVLAALKACGAPAVDPAFRVAVMERLAQRRVNLELIVNLLATGLLMVGLALAGQGLILASGAVLGSVSMILPGLALVAIVAFFGHRLVTGRLRLPGM